MDSHSIKCVFEIRWRRSNGGDSGDGGAAAKMTEAKESKVLLSHCRAWRISWQDVIRKRGRGEESHFDDALWYLEGGSN